MRPALKFCWLLTLSLSLGSLDAPAQEPAKVPAAEPAQESVEEPTTLPLSKTPPLSKPWQTQAAERPAAPDVYLLPDASGKLRKVLGFRYEDFFEAWRHEEGASVVAPPRYVLDAWEVTGEVSEAQVRLRIEFEIAVQTTGWIDIPVQLPEFIVQQLTIDDQIGGECLVFDKQRHGHVIWLSGRAGQKRKLVVEGLARLKINAGNHSLELYLPRATTSQFSLRVPGTSLRFENSPELTLTTVANVGKADQDVTEIRLLGQANPLRLGWTATDEQTTNQAAFVEAEGQTTVRLDRRRVDYEATLRINSLVEKPVEKIQVRLPPFAKLKQDNTLGGYEIRESGMVSGQDPRQLVEIRRSEPTENTWELRLLAESPLEAFSGSAGCAVEGFEVLDAVRQSGTVTLEIDDQLQAYFNTHGDIDQTPLQKALLASERSSILGQFRYSRFPWRLVVISSPRQKRVSVKPEYQLTIHSDEARLEVEFDYQFTGAQVFSLRINLQGWKLTAPIESGGLIDSDRIQETLEPGRWVLPLVDPETQQLRLNLSLRKEIQHGDNTFFLPEALEASLVDGELLVHSTEAMQVIPKFEEMTGLGVIAKSENNLPGSIDPDAAESQDQIRLRTFLARPKFAAEIALRQRQIIATQQTQVAMDRQTIRVRQQIDYQAKYQPVSQLALSLSESLWLNDSMTVTLSGTPLPFGLDTSLNEEVYNEEVFDRQEAELTGGEAPRKQPSEQTTEQTSKPISREMIVSLPRPMQGNIPIEIDYELPTPELGSEELTPLLLPVASPHDRVSRHEASVSATQPVLVTANQRSNSEAWNVVSEASEAHATAASLRLETDQNLLFLPLYAQLDSTNKEQLATLERAWIQSWITAGQRQDRAVFRFRTAHTTVYARLPQTLENAEIEVLLDGNPWQYQLVTENRLAVTLPAEGQPESHSLELRYQTSAALPSWGKLPSSLPQLECRVASAPIYWQLILPRGWQVTTAPKQLLPDYWLGWKNYRWGRQPSRTQAGLEQITGAVSAAAPTPLSAQYVYRAFEMPAEIEVVVVRQIWLLLCGVLATFGLGLLAFKTSLARSGFFWLGLALTLLVGVFSYPEMMLLAIQVILAGGLMTFATSVLRRIFVKGRSPLFSTTSYPQRESSIEATEPWQPQQLDESPTSSGTTATLQTGGPTT